MYFVYILKGRTHYVGYTNDLQRRLEEHRRNKTYYVNRIGNRELLGYFEKSTQEEAEKLEKMIKKNGHIEYWINHETFIKN